MELVGFRQIGTGKHATVYLARDRTLGRDVAVKVIRGWASDQGAAESLQDLRVLAGHLSQRSQTALIFDVDTTTDGGVFVVTEYAEGGTTATLLGTYGPLPAEQVIAIGLAASQTLATAHAEGVLHQAMSPENLLLDADGLVKVSDFGIAAFLDSLQPGQGSLNEHVAPEVVAGGIPEAAGDVYALGSTLYALLEGRSPLRKTRRELLKTIDRRKVDGEQPKPMTHGDSPGLQALISKMLDPVPSDRPTAANVVLQLSPLATATVTALAPPQPGPIVVLDHFAEQIEKADIAAETATRAAQAPMFSENVALLTGQRLRHERRRSARLAGAIGAAAALLVVVALARRPDPQTTAAATGVGLTTTSASSRSAGADTGSGTALPTTILVASAAPPGNASASSSTTTTTTTNNNNNNNNNNQ